MSKYIYDTSLEDEHTRLHALEEVLDPGTIRVLESIGVQSTWRCLEVGGGGGSIAGWLAAHAGHVVATDLDTRFLERIKASNLEILQHNAVTDHFGEDVYDLVHSRDVLEHIPERELVLDKMVAALKPGGWLVAEDADFTAGLRAEGFAEMNECTELEGRMWQPIVKAMSARGIDAEYGRRLPWRLAARGLTDIDADIRAPLGKAGSPMARLNALSIHQLRPLFLEGGMMEEEVERLIAYVEGDDFMGYGPLHIAAWGRKPA